MSVVIVSFPQDIHAVATLTALEKIGRKSDLFYCGDFPGTSAGTFSLEADDFWFDGPSVENFREATTVWNRRVTRPTAPAEAHPADVKYIESLGSLFIDYFANYPFRERFWVNPGLSQRQIDSKAFQLSLARKLGLRTPPTIISNDPAAVRAFVAASRDAIVKPLMPMHWSREASDISMLTTAITLADLQDDYAIRSCPMIYQDRIQKETEYRIVVMGRDVLCFDLNSQDAPGALLDWRAISPTGLDIRQIDCPAPLAELILSFMSHADLRFGCFDFAVDRDGGFVFFEVNEQGQFLWLERACPDSRLLDRFARFLAEGDPDYRYDPGGSPPVTWGDLEASGQLQAAAAALESRHARFEPKIYVEEDASLGER